MKKIINLFSSWHELLKLSQQLKVLAFSMFVNRVGTMAFPFLILYLTDSLHLSQDRAAVVLLIYGVTTLVAGPVSGWCCDKFSTLFVMKITLVLSSLALLCYPLVTSFSGIIVMTVLWAFFAEGHRPAAMATTDLIASEHERQAAILLNRLAINLGASFGPAIGGFLAAVSYKLLFVIDGITGLIATLVIVLAIHETRLDAVTAKNLKENKLRFSLRDITVDMRFVMFLLASFVVALVFFQHLSGLALFVTKDLHLSESVYGLLFSINGLIIILIEVPLVQHIRKYSVRLNLAFAALMYAVGFGVLYFVTGKVGLYASVILWTIGEMILFPVGNVYVLDVAPSGKRGWYLGLYQLSFAVAFVIAPWISVQTRNHYGSQMLWLGSFLCGVLATGMFLLVKKPSNQQAVAL